MTMMMMTIVVMKVSDPYLMHTLPYLVFFHITNKPKQQVHNSRGPHVLYRKLNKITFGF